MTVVRPSGVCSRIREQVSLQLDGELSQLERRMLASHLGRCADCRAFADDVMSFTDKLRHAPMERLERPVVVTSRRRISTARFQVGIAAAFAFAALGLGTQLALGPSSDFADFESVSRFPTLTELEREVAMIEALGHHGSRNVIPR
jgi:predicted anti-sigma-YlaC factor YlaD